MEAIISISIPGFDPGSESAVLIERLIGESLAEAGIVFVWNEFTSEGFVLELCESKRAALLLARTLRDVHVAPETTLEVSVFDSESCELTCTSEKTFRLGDLLR